jgi:hypothetical protein
VSISAWSASALCGKLSLISEALSKGTSRDVIFGVAPASRLRDRHTGSGGSPDRCAPERQRLFPQLEGRGDRHQSIIVQFGLTETGIAPAGVERPNTGHHHMLIDTTLSPDELKQPIAMDDKHRHFGGGQTETILSLPPGHTLSSSSLLIGRMSHSIRR